MNKSNEELEFQIDILNISADIYMGHYIYMDHYEDFRVLSSFIYKTGQSLYEQILNDVTFENLKYLAMYSLLSYMADKEIHSIIKNYKDKINHQMHLYNELPILKRLEYDTYCLIISFWDSLDNSDELIKLNPIIEQADNSLDIAQKEQLSITDENITDSLKIVIFANIIYIVTTLKEYLLKDKNSDVNKQDISNTIDESLHCTLLLLKDMDMDMDLQIIYNFVGYAYRKTLSI